MTVNTPFADRPATPFWDPRGRWGGEFADADSPNWARNNAEWGRQFGMGDAADVVGGITSDITDVFRTVYSSQPGMYTVQNADGSWTTYRQPIGTAGSLPVGQVNLGTQVAGKLDSGSSVLLVLGLAAAAFFIFGRRR